MLKASGFGRGEGLPRHDHLIEFDESRAGNVIGVYETLMSN
jgi:hypothetical protein